MTKLLKFTGKCVSITLEWFLVLLIFFAFFVRTSPVQTYLAKQITRYFSEELHTKFNVGKVSIVFFNKIALDDVEIEDLDHTKMFFMKSVFFKFQGVNQIKREIRIKEIALEDGNITIYNHKKNGEFNYEFLVNYFSTPNKKKKKSYSFKVNSLQLTSIHAKYDDYRKPYDNRQIDYNHIELRNLNLRSEKLSFSQGILKTKINALAFKEKCGLEVITFSCSAKVSSSGIYTKNLEFETQRSKVNLPVFEMHFKDWKDFTNFDDNVTFNALLEKSIVDMKDIQFFAHHVKGMDQICTIQAKVSDKLRHLKIDDLSLSFGKQSKIQGDIILPDFRNLDFLNYEEKISYCSLSIDDIEHFTFPSITNISPIQFNSYLKKLNHFEGKNIKISGNNQLATIQAERINTKVGSFQLPKGVLIKHNKKEKNYHYSTLASDVFPIQIDSLHLGEITSSSMLSKFSGNYNLEGNFDFNGNFSVEKLNCNLNHSEINDYSFKNIVISNFSYIENKISCELDIKDPNLELNYFGEITLHEGEKYTGTIEISKANLFPLHFFPKETARVIGKISGEIDHTSSNKFTGDLNLRDFIFQEGNAEIPLSNLSLSITNKQNKDNLRLNSDFGNVKMKGDIQFSTIYNEIVNQISEVIPNLTNTISNTKKQKNEWEYQIEVKNIKPLLSYFVPELTISKGTKILGEYSDNELYIDCTSPLINYKEYSFKRMKSEFSFIHKKFEAITKFNRITLKDSIELTQCSFKSTGENNLFQSEVNWNQKKDKSEIKWNTLFKENNVIEFDFFPSNLFVLSKNWDIPRTFSIIYTPEKLTLSEVVIRHKNESLVCSGDFSKNEFDQAFLKVQNFDLSTLSNLSNIPYTITGELNGNVILSSAFENPSVTGKSQITKLYINKQEIGDITSTGEWNNELKSIFLKGNLSYKQQPSIQFTGNYFTQKSEDNINFELSFKNSDLQFTNAFMDPEIISNIQGEINGKLHLYGSTQKPILEGDLDLVGGKGKFALLNTNYQISGKILVDRYGFYTNNIPIKDEEGKTGSVVATIYHQNFENWNFDVSFNLEKDITSIPGMVQPIDRFLIMNTNYSDEEIYYGKGYGTGDVNINGTIDNLDITVNIQTKKGTNINFPMYQTSTFEEDNFIVFKDKKSNKLVVPQLKYTGLSLDLNFKITPEAKLKLIFNEQLEDEITAFGYGDINIQLDQNNNVKMNGIYRIKNDNTNVSTYNFVLGPIKQLFIIQENGTISWNGDPYIAKVDMTTYYTVNTNLKEIMPIQSASQSIQEVRCNLRLNETILKPNVSFEIELPKTTTGVSDDAKAAVARINANKDELNKQFFSLLLWKKFQPFLSNSNSVGTNYVADLVSNQINSLLGDLSKEVKFNVIYNVANTSDLSQSDLTQAQASSKLAVGVTKNFLDGKLLLNGTFGRSTLNNQSDIQNQLIGNLNVEYKLNESGTLRLNGFNETNDFNTSLQLNSKTTQGIGLNYQEEFTKISDFQLLNSISRWFKHEEEIKKNSNKKRRPLPAEKDTLSVHKNMVKN